MNINKEAQTLAEKTIILAVVISAFFAMQTYIKRGVQARIKTGVSAGVNLANKAIPDFDSVFQQKDHNVYYLLRCVDDCQIQVYNMTQQAAYQEDNPDVDNWYDGLTQQMQAQCIQTKCIDKLSHLLNKRVAGEPLSGEVLRKYLLPNVDDSGELEHSEAFNSDDSYNYRRIFEELFIAKEVVNSFEQYEPYYESSEVKYNLEQMNLETQEGDELTVSSGTTTSLRTEGGSGFDVTVDKDRWK